MILVFLLSLIVRAQDVPSPPPPPEQVPAAELEQMGGPEHEAESEGTGRDLGILEGIIEDYDYRGQDKRDPFAPFVLVKPVLSGTPIGPVTPLERFDLEQLRLVGIIWNVPKPKALVLDPDNKTYVVYNKTRIGRNNGYVAEIREGEVVIVESYNNQGRLSYQPRVVKLQRE